MQEEPTSLRIDDPGVRALFTEAARFQSWLDVEAALAQAQAELGIIPDGAAREITRKASLPYLDRSLIASLLTRARVAEGAELASISSRVESEAFSFALGRIASAQ